jgi:hypothetical protein
VGDTEEIEINSEYTAGDVDGLQAAMDRYGQEMVAYESTIRLPPILLGEEDIEDEIEDAEDDQAPAPRRLPPCAFIDDEVLEQISDMTDEDYQPQNKRQKGAKSQ